MNLSQIEKALVSEGFSRTYETVKLVEYVRGQETVYLKKLTESHPLVVHGRHASQISSLASIAGVERKKPVTSAYHNSNMRNFDRRMNSGKKPTRYGIDFSFSSEKGLRSLLSLL